MQITADASSSGGYDDDGDLAGDSEEARRRRRSRQAEVEAREDMRRLAAKTLAHMGETHAYHHAPTQAGGKQPGGRHACVLLLAMDVVSRCAAPRSASLRCALMHCVALLCCRYVGGDTRQAAAAPWAAAARWRGWQRRSSGRWRWRWRWREAARRRRYRRRRAGLSSDAAAQGKVATAVS